MKPRVVITQRVHEQVISYLGGSCDVVPNLTCRSLSRHDIMERSRTANAVIVFMSDWIDEGFLEQCPNIKIVSAALKGYDNIDVGACTRHGVWLTIVEDLLTTPTAELVLGLMIGLGRRLVDADHFVRTGRFTAWAPQFYGTGLSGATLGIVGMGALGAAVATRALAFDMDVLYSDIRPDCSAPADTYRVSLSELLNRSDYVVLLVPLTANTAHLVDEETIKSMKPGARLINVSRGSVVCEQAVSSALATGHLAGYAADVFEMEDWARPNRRRYIPRELLESTDKTMLSPHLGSAVAEVRLAIEMTAARQVVQALSGETPDQAVNAPGMAQ